MTVFVSYTRADESLVRALRQDLDRMGHQVWLDHEIHGGELWWREIIRTIQAARVFVFALSEASWKSVPCHTEFEYAQQLGVPVLPVQVGPLDHLRIPIMERQLVDYRERSADAVVALAGALTELTARPRVLPNPLPPPPKVPFEYLYRIAELLGPQPIAPERQEIIIGQLRRHLRTERDEVARADIVKLLREFRERGEITNLNSREIDEILANVEPGAGEDLPEGATWLSAADDWEKNPVVIGPPPPPEEEPVQPPNAPPPAGPATTPTWLRDVMAAEGQPTATHPKPATPPPATPPSSPQWWQGGDSAATWSSAERPAAPQPEPRPPEGLRSATKEQAEPEPSARRWSARRLARLSVLFFALAVVYLVAALNVPSIGVVAVPMLIAGVVFGVLALRRRER
ncbi:toll/interleukin-1 receptor domain-containing protein [Saccharothrix saharensis]|uniref:toll/interleukin-1 receptor domain-containing protein n=1 Tax=Saccharothrix saharensis TaxID=571190 RepID=UPI003689FAAD